MASYKPDLNEENPEETFFNQMSRNVLFEQDKDGETVVKIPLKSFQIMVNVLHELCLRDAGKHLTTDNVCGIIQLTDQYSLEKVRDECYRFIENNALCVLQSESFLSLSHNSLIQLMELDTLSLVKEIHIFRAALRWANSRCKRQGLANNAVNIRKVLGDALYRIRVPLCDPDEMSEIIESGILSKDDLADLHIYQVQGGKTKTKMKFSASRRFGRPWEIAKFVPRQGKRSEIKEVVRFRTNINDPKKTLKYAGCNSEFPWSYPYPNYRQLEVIGFKWTVPEDRKCYLHGVCIYGGMEKPAKYNLKMELVDDDDNNLQVGKGIHKTDLCVDTDGTNRYFPCLFDKPILLPGSYTPTKHPYVLYIWMENGERSCYGEDGIRKWVGEDLIVEFESRRRDTCVEYGQIPVLLFSVE